MLGAAAAVVGAGPGQLAALVFADGDILHLGRHNAPAGVVHLGDVVAGPGPPGTTAVRKTQGGQLWITLPQATIVGRPLGQLLALGPGANPGRPLWRNAAAHIDANLWIGIRPGGVVDEQPGPSLGLNLTKRHPHPLRPFDIDLA